MSGFGQKVLIPLSKLWQFQKLHFAACRNTGESEPSVTLTPINVDITVTISEILLGIVQIR